MLTIYGADLSSPLSKVRYTADYLGLKYEFKRVSLMKGEHRTPEFLKLHPAGKIPVMDDDGFVLFESNAIIKYLADKSSSDIYPKDIKKRAVVDQWLDFVTIHIGAAVNRVAFNRIFAPIINAPVDEQSLQDGLNFLKRFFPVVETRLGACKFLAGENLTLADINLLSVMDPCQTAGIDLVGYPALSKWRDGLIQKDFYTACLKDREEAAKSLLAQRK